MSIPCIKNILVDFVRSSDKDSDGNEVVLTRRNRSCKILTDGEDVNNEDDEVKDLGMR